MVLVDNDDNVVVAAVVVFVVFVEVSYVTV